MSRRATSSRARTRQPPRRFELASDIRGILAADALGAALESDAIARQTLRPSTSMPVEKNLLPCVEIEPARKAQWSIVWLHGLGADGHDFPPIVPHLALDARIPVRFVFPHAPRIPVSINAGMVMPAWYDIRDLELKHRHDESGIKRSADQLRALIARENERGVACRNIVLAGFSQGGAIAAYVALRHPQPLAGLIALSTYLVVGDKLAAEVAPANRAIEVFEAHGTLDPMVRFERGVALRDTLIETGCQVSWHEYPMQHEVCMEEIAELGSWLNARLRRT
jgi:phospholipase/carboxylesterase